MKTEFSALSVTRWVNDKLIGESLDNNVEWVCLYKDHRVRMLYRQLFGKKDIQRVKIPSHLFPAVVGHVKLAAGMQLSHYFSIQEGVISGHHREREYKLRVNYVVMGEVSTTLIHFAFVEGI